MTTYVKKWGNSLAIRIPKHLLDSMRLKEGSPLVFEKEGGKLLIKPIQNRRLELVATFKRARKDPEIKKMAGWGFDDVALFNLVSGGFDFLSDEPDLYTADDCKVRLR